MASRSSIDIMKLSHVIQNQTKSPWRVVFFGTDDFSLRVLQALFENRVTKGSPSCVVKKLAIVHSLTRKMTPVQRYASVCGIDGFDWPLKNPIRKFDVGVLASFGHLVPSRVINMFPYGIINVHPSLLPQWRGAAPLHHTILSGSSSTGVSIMALKPKHFDIGPVLLQKEMQIPPKSTTHSLRELLAVEGGKMILEVLASLPQFYDKSLPQDDRNISYAHKLTQAHTFIDWQNQSKSQLDRQYRGLHEHMELRSVWEGKTIRLFDMVDVHTKPSIELNEESKPGLPLYCKKDNLIWIKCKDDWVGFKNIVIKKKMGANEFYNGYLSKPYLKGAICASVSNNLFDETYNEWIQNRLPR